MKDLNKREQKIWEYILKYEVDNKCMPSNAQIAHDLKLNFSRQFIHELVTDTLKKKGYKSVRKRLREVIPNT